jgi:hypothetical protein
MQKVSTSFLVKVAQLLEKRAENSCVSSSNLLLSGVLIAKNEHVDD